MIHSLLILQGKIWGEECEECYGFIPTRITFLFVRSFAVSIAHEAQNLVPRNQI